MSASEERPIKFFCELCGQKIGVAAHLASARVRCPGCEEAVEVPGARTKTPRLDGRGALEGPFARKSTTRLPAASSVERLTSLCVACGFASVPLGFAIVGVPLGWVAFVAGAIALRRSAPRRPILLGMGAAIFGHLAAALVLSVYLLG